MIKRYEIFSASITSVNGEWVSYEDHLTEVAALREKLAACEKNASLWNEYLPWMRRLNKKPFNLAMEISRIDSIQQSKDRAQPTGEK